MLDFDTSEQCLVSDSPSRRSLADTQALPEGAQIAEFRVLGIVGQGGFGIVYRAFDVLLQRDIALKEYLPSSLASRTSEGHAVVPSSSSCADAFEAGLKSFVNEARLLARFDHPALVKVYRFWEANGTAYMAMPLYEGPTLGHMMQTQGPGASESEIRRWLVPLLDALGTLHAAHCYHRDISPDNIILTSNGPLLLDFGAARRVIGDMTQSLTVVLKPGYAPIEQYGGSSALPQGPWTDLYALACVVRKAVTGRVPMTAVQRLMLDDTVPLRNFAVGRYSEGLIRAIDAATAVRPGDRPQDVASFAALLDSDPRPPDSSLDIDLLLEAPCQDASSPGAAQVATPRPRVAALAGAGIAAFTRLRRGLRSGRVRAGGLAAAVLCLGAAGTSPGPQSRPSLPAQAPTAVAAVEAGHEPRASGGDSPGSRPESDAPIGIRASFALIGNDAPRVRGSDLENTIEPVSGAATKAGRTRIGSSEGHHDAPPEAVAVGIPASDAQEATSAEPASTQAPVRGSCADLLFRASLGSLPLETAAHLAEHCQ